MRENPRWKRKLHPVGNSTGITIPQELLNYINAKKGTMVAIIGDHSKHGKYIALWNPKQKQ